MKKWGNETCLYTFSAMKRCALNTDVNVFGFSIKKKKNGSKQFHKNCQKRRLLFFSESDIVLAHFNIPDRRYSCRNFVLFCSVLFGGGFFAEVAGKIVHV